MRSKKVPDKGPKQKLLAAAERLFAEHGFDVVSVRDITQAVKGNVAAVNYHFGSREALVNLVMSRCLGPINEERLARLAVLEERLGVGVVSVGEVVEALVLPVVERMQESRMSELLYCRLVGRAFGSLAGLPADIERQCGEVLARTRRLLSRLLPEVPAEELVWRIHFMAGGMLHTLTHREDLVRLAEGAAGKPDLALTAERFVRFAVAGLEGSQLRTQVPEEPTDGPPLVISESAEPILATVVVADVPPAGAAPEVPASPPEPAIAIIADGGGAEDKGPAKAPGKRAKEPAEEGPQGFFSF